LGALIATVTLKAVVAGGVIRLLGFPLRVAVIVGVSLAQVGEFSFVLASVGMGHGLLGEQQQQIFLAVAVLSLIVTPFLIRFATWAGAHVGTPVRLPDPGTKLAPHDSMVTVRRPDVAAAAAAGAAGADGAAAADPGAAPDPDTLAGHVVVAGYGVNGRNVARALRELGIPYIVLEMDTAIIRRARAEGERIAFGDVSRPEGLHACRVDRAGVVVLAISDPAGTRYAVAQIRRSNPGAYIIARTRQVAEVAELTRLGADEVIPEEFETSIAILARVLRRFRVPSNLIRIQEQALRGEGYSFLRGSDVTGSLMNSITRLIAGATTDTFYLEPGSPAIGQTLSAFDLRGRTRALIIAVVREGKHYVSPDPDFALQEADILVLVGDHQSLEAAFEVLSAP
jgi:CPA2 family monovalent cation:H+ antiporter-2